MFQYFLANVAVRPASIDGSNFTPLTEIYGADTIIGRAATLAPRKAITQFTRSP